MSGLRRRLMRLAMLALFLAIWEAAFRVGLLSPIIFASPSLIVSAAIKDGWTFLLAFRITVFEIAVAILIAWTLGIAFGVVAGSLPVLARISAPVLSALIAVPLVVLYPVLIAWLGLGPASKVVFGVVSGIFQIALNTMIGVREINRGYATMAAAMGANRRQIMFQVMAPLALPAIVSGLRLGTALIVIGVVLSEMLGSTDGIGFWISYHRALFNTGQVYLGILLALLIALAFASLGAFIGLRTGSGEAVQGVFPLFFVFLFLSSSSLPRNLIEHDWFRIVATWNPVSYLFEGLRSLIIFGWQAQALLLGFGFAAVIALIGVVGSTSALRTRLAAR